jgi:uncharacterized protein (DUF2461 family)
VAPVRSPFPGFPREGLTFLRQLRRNNNRPWFTAHKETYEQGLREPMFALVTALGGAVQGFAPELVTDPKRAVYRIYRDVRFSKDKSPYKTHIAAHFSANLAVCAATDAAWGRTGTTARRAGLERHAGAGLYFHMAPEEVLIAGGVYMPGPEELRAIRGHVAEHSDELERILRQRSFRVLYGGLQGDRLSRPPKGWAADHPAIEWLRYKQYIAWFERPAKVAATPELFRLLLRGFIAVMPLVRFLNTPLRAAARAASAAE